MRNRKLDIRTLYAMVCAAFLSCVALSGFAAESDARANSDFPESEEAEILRQTALSGSAESQFKLGELFEYGRGVERSDSKAAYWYEQAASQQYALAQYRLAILYDNGWGNPVNKEKAFVLYKAAAEQGVELAQHDVAIAYYQGSGTEKNLLLAYKWLKIADLNGNPLMQKHLNLVASEMSPDEIESAKFLAEGWIELMKNEI